MNIHTVTLNEISFVDVHDPQALELKSLRNDFGFSELHLDDYLNRQQVPKIEVTKDYILIVLDFPSFDPPQEPTAKHLINGHESENGSKTKAQTQNHEGEKKKSLLVSPLAQIPFVHSKPKKKRIRTAHATFFIGEKYLVVLHDERSPVIDEMFAHCQQTLRKREELMGLGPQYLFYRLVDLLVDTCFTTMNDIAATIDRIDQHLTESKSPTVIIEDITVTRRNIVVFQTMMKTALIIFRELEQGKYKEVSETMFASWRNITDHLQRVWYRLEDSSELIEGISSSNESFLTFRNNEMVKFLTIVTAISFPFVIVNNLYSMNVRGLPYATEPWIVTVLFFVIAMGGTSVILYFKYKKWL